LRRRRREKKVKEGFSSDLIISTKKKRDFDPEKIPISYKDFYC